MSETGHPNTPAPTVLPIFGADDPRADAAHCHRSARVDELTDTLCRYWRTRGDRDWARYAWGLLVSHGVADPDPERAVEACRLVALAHLSETFHDLGSSCLPDIASHDEVGLDDVDVCEVARDLGIPGVPDPALADELALADEWYIDEAAPQLWSECVDQLFDENLQALVRLLGARVLAEDLWAQAYSEEDLRGEPGDETDPQSDLEAYLVASGAPPVYPLDEHARRVLRGDCFEEFAMRFEWLEGCAALTGR